MSLQLQYDRDPRRLLLMRKKAILDQIARVPSVMGLRGLILNTRSLLHSNDEIDLRFDHLYAHESYELICVMDTSEEHRIRSFIDSHNDSAKKLQSVAVIVMAFQFTDLSNEIIRLIYNQANLIVLQVDSESDRISNGIRFWEILDNRFFYDPTSEPDTLIVGQIFWKKSNHYAAVSEAADQIGSILQSIDPTIELLYTRCFIAFVRSAKIRWVAHVRPRYEGLILYIRLPKNVDHQNHLRFLQKNFVSYDKTSNSWCIDVDIPLETYEIKFIEQILTEIMIISHQCNSSVFLP